MKTSSKYFRGLHVAIVHMLLVFTYIPSTQYFKFTWLNTPLMTLMLIRVVYQCICFSHAKHLLEIRPGVQHCLSFM